MATLILGGGVPKNYNLQPEPALGQVLGLPNVRGYEFDVQITTAPVTDGSLSSCPPAEAVTWGKVDKDTYLQTTESLPADYSMVMPFLVKALMEKHGKREPYRLVREARTSGREAARRGAGEPRMADAVAALPVGRVSYSTRTPFQNATRPLISLAAGMGSA